MYPGAEANSIELHYPKSTIMDEFAIGVYDKVNLYAFLIDYSKLDDFELGYFLHLVTDYLFFHECFDYDYLINTNRKEFCKNLYHSYDCLASYLFAKYSITKEDYKDYPSEYYSGIPYEEYLLSKELVDNFIKRVISIDLEKYVNKIREYKGNVKP